jgi:hypothetical protein
LSGVGRTRRGISRTSSQAKIDAYHIVALNARTPFSFRSALPQSFNCDEAKLHAPYLNPRDAIGSDLCDLEKVAGPASFDVCLPVAVGSPSKRMRAGAPRDYAQCSSTFVAFGANHGPARALTSSMTATRARYCRPLADEPNQTGVDPKRKFRFPPRHLDFHRHTNRKPARC